MIDIKFDTLLQALVLYSKLYHKPISAEALMHALPIEYGSANAELFSVKDAKSLMSRAAAKAGLTSTLVHKSLHEISKLHLPIILLLRNNESCILEAFSDGI